MRILCLTSRLPYPPNRGDRLRAFHFLNSLSRQHEIHLLSFIAEAKELLYLKELQAICKDVKVVRMSKLESILAVISKIWIPMPLQVLYYRSKKMRSLVRQKLAAYSFDAAYIHLFRMASYLEEVKSLYRIVDLTDVISREITRSMPYRSLPSRSIYAFEQPRIHNYERKVTRRFEEIWLISDADGKALIADCPGSNIQIVTNGIDTQRFFPVEVTHQSNSIIFTGHFGVAHNIDAALVLAKQVLPLVKQTIPCITLSLVGAEPSAAVVKLGNLPGVHVSGYVPDLNIHLNQSAVFAAPLRFAAGIQNKVLEAMAAARPVVTTTIVNEGINACPGKELVIADSVEDMAREIIDLIQKPDEAMIIGKAAQRFVTSKYSWDNALDRVNQIEKDLLSKS